MKIYSDLNITRVCVMLGEACDFKCRHCIQQDIHSGIKKTVSEKLIKYLQHICDLHPGIALQRRDLVKISFWGGEPLLYFKQIKEIIERVDRPNAEYSIVTNGANLTEKVVEYFNSLDRGVIFLSNDGPDTAKVRDVNMLDSKEFCDLFNSVNMRGIDSVIHAYNQDYYRLWDYIGEKCGDIPIAHEFLEVNWAMPADLYSVDFEKYRQSCEKVTDNLIKNVLAGNIECREYELYWRAISNLHQVLRREANGQPTSLYPACGPYHYASHINLQGNMYVCHSGFGKLGPVDLGFDGIYENCQLALAVQEKKRVKKCEECFAVALCKKGCPYVLGDLPGNEQMCEMRRIFYKACIDMMPKFNNSYTPVEL